MSASLDGGLSVGRTLDWRDGRHDRVLTVGPLSRRHCNQATKTHESSQDVSRARSALGVQGPCPWVGGAGGAAAPPRGLAERTQCPRDRRPRDRCPGDRCRTDVDTREQQNKKKCGHKIDHNSSSRPPFDIKSSALDRIFHARFIGNSFEYRNLQTKFVLRL